MQLFKNVFRSGMIIYHISNEEINDIIKIVKSFELSAFLLKYVSKTIKNKAKEQKEEFY